MNVYIVLNIFLFTGKVLKVDGPYCAVRFPTAPNNAAPAAASQDKTKELI